LKINQTNKRVKFSEVRCPLLTGEIKYRYDGFKLIIKVITHSTVTFTECANRTTPCMLNSLF